MSGAHRGDLGGALAATVAVVLPSFIVILLVMTLLKKLLSDQYTQAALRGMKPCIIGIILATGAYMICRNCFGVPDAFRIDTTALAMTAFLAAVYFGSRKILKGGLSPIMLIVISALAGILVYARR